uniref:Uncharacterized protein n=1 Tax=Vitis vinifera TaxID=29760 RepID=A5BY70_VITVI|nr:hypothetical protein VITISV_010850 [Vitis vinifera]
MGPVPPAPNSLSKSPLEALLAKTRLHLQQKHMPPLRLSRLPCTSDIFKSHQLQIGPRELTDYTDCATLIEECKANVVRRISIPSKAKRNPLKYWRYYIIDMNQSIGVEKHIQVPKYRSRQIRLRQVVSAMGKPTTKSIFEFDSEMVYIDSK